MRQITITLSDSTYRGLHDMFFMGTSVEGAAARILEEAVQEDRQKAEYARIRTEQFEASQRK